VGGRPLRIWHGFDSVEDTHADIEDGDVVLVAWRLFDGKKSRPRRLPAQNCSMSATQRLRMPSADAA